MGLILNNIKISKEKKRIDYEYILDKNIRKYFHKNSFFVEYTTDISEVPCHINVIPFLVNVMPIAWFADFRVKVDKIDSNFLKALKDLKLEFSKYYPLNNPNDCMLDYDQIIYNKSNESNNQEAMLFSGGVDAYTTLLRHNSKKIDLITIHGADIKLDDHNQWNDLIQYIENTEAIKENPKHFIKSNLRDFITFEVDKLLPNLGWWGKVQHGMALTGLTAPICYLNNIKTLYIASSYTRKKNYEFIPWGSMPEIDNKLIFNFTNVIHDGENLTRQEKVNLIVTSQKIPIRACYNEFKSNLNCNSCEKCYRTIYAILINNRNPIDYGFEFDESKFVLLKSKINNQFTSKGNRLFWEEIYLQSISNRIKYNSHLLNWQYFYNEIENILENNLKNDIVKLNKWQVLKQNYIRKYPKIFSIYLRIRRKFL